MPNSNRKTIFTTISIDKETAALVEKICKRYSLKKSEVVKLAFGYIDKAHINPSEAPESVKSELAKINKRQDDIIRFIRHYEEEQLNPMIRATNSIAIYADFPNPDKILVANAYVDVLVERTMPDAYVVKQNLVTMDASGNYIYTVRGSKLYKTPVKIVASLDDGYVLGNRFAKDEYLVLDKVGRLPENVKIKLNVVSPSARAKENK